MQYFKRSNKSKGEIIFLYYVVCSSFWKAKHRSDNRPCNDVVFGYNNNVIKTFLLWNKFLIAEGKLLFKIAKFKWSRRALMLTNKTESKFSPRSQANNVFSNLFKSIQFFSKAIQTKQKTFQLYKTFQTSQTYQFFSNYAAMMKNIIYEGLIYFYLKRKM